jgi:NAD+ diphosphatase
MLARVFVPAVRPPETPSRQAVWFAFKGDRLLVVPAEAETGLPAWEELERLGCTPAAGHYLGRLEDVDCFAVELEDCELPDGRTFEGLRALYGRLPEHLFSVAGRAAQILEWDRSHRFCGRCGARTERMEDERARRCPECEHLAYPRLSPAVIMLIRKGDEILLARNAQRGGFWSVLAGFVEPGESLEEAVVREVNEEVSLQIRDLRYFGSQPWPFPHQLMVGFTANYASGEIKVDPHELVEAGWFHKDKLPEQIPSKISIARRLIDSACG